MDSVFIAGKPRSQPNLLKTSPLIDNVKRLLDSTVSNISDISEKVGYSAPKYFSKLLKKITGKTVYEYRKGRRQSP